ncbi:MAG: fructose-bisphosphatase class III [Verrucomicrobia bacterium]|nr:fructose-bisphosphatase class III [Verrucomicrobiota bacterium]
MESDKNVESRADSVDADDAQRTVRLHPLAREVPNIDAAVAEIARFSAELTLPQGTIHVISDIHGEYEKLRHIINNASGTLRPLVERLFKDCLPPERFQELLTLIFYPAEVVGRLERTLASVEERKAYAMRTLQDLFEIVRVLVARRSLRHATRVFPAPYRDLLVELLHEPTTERDRAYVEAIVDALARHGRVLHLIHLTGRVIRNLAIDELVIAGDCWDRGARGDRVVDYLMQQPNVSFVWGNHDAAWLGACLGYEALICQVLRISLRYRRLLQLEEGYGIPMAPLDLLARTVYANDPAASFAVKGSGMREAIMMARMQKATAIMQFKLEGQAIARHPEWNLEHRRLLHRIDRKAGTVELDGTIYPLRDAYLPTVDPADPYALSPEEEACLERVRASFLASQKLWNQMRWMVGQGRMHLVREGHLIFHGCVPVDEAGGFLPMFVRGQPYRGKALFGAIEREVYHLVEDGPPSPEELDLLWYLWSGPESPLFGKDRITTFERDFIADKRTHHETKNPYFRLIHEVPFCDAVLAEFGVDPEEGMIVNGHVPVAIEKGESPLKKSGKAITIDGAFSEAYGDHGFTLVLEPQRTFVATHHHLESVQAAIEQGADIIPGITEVRRWERPRRVADSRRSREIRAAMDYLDRLIEAYRHHDLPQQFGA